MVVASSDLLLGVIRAADPVRYRCSVNKLARVSNVVNRGNNVKSFASILRQDFAANNSGSALSGVKSMSEAYERFESYVLQSFVDKMFGSNSSAMFGQGEAGIIWRSLMSRAIGDEMAKSGGIGIAKLLNHSSPVKGRTSSVESLFAFRGDKATSYGVGEGCKPIYNLYRAKAVNSKDGLVS